MIFLGTSEIDALATAVVGAADLEDRFKVQILTLILQGEYEMLQWNEQQAREIHDADVRRQERAAAKAAKLAEQGDNA